MLSGPGVDATEFRAEVVELSGLLSTIHDHMDSDVGYNLFSPAWLGEVIRNQFTCAHNIDVFEEALYAESFEHPPRIA
jgi:hypothetical protein